MCNVHVHTLFGFGIFAVPCHDGLVLARGERLVEFGAAFQCDWLNVTCLGSVHKKKPAGCPLLISGKM